MALDQAGVQFVAQGASKYIADVGNAARATTAMGSQIGAAAATAQRGTSLFTSVGNAMGGIAKIAAGFAVGQALYAFPRWLSSAVTDAKEAEAAEIRLGQAIKNLGGNVAANNAAYDKAIKNGANLAFSYDEQRSALAILTAETSSSVNTLSRYKIAQDLARGANLDLVTASRLLGKVTDENVNVLARYGIKVQKGADDTQLFGAIQAKFGGQAQAFANSTAGMMERASISMQELKERVGGILLPIMVTLANVTSRVVAPAFAGLIGMIERFGTSVIKTLGRLLGGGFQINFFGELKAEYEGLIGFIEGGQTASEWNNTTLGQFAFWVRDHVMPVLTTFKEGMIDAYNHIFKYLIGGFKEATDFIKKDVTPTFNNLTKSIEEGSAKLTLFGRTFKLPELDLNTVSALVQATTAIIATIVLLPGPVHALGILFATVFNPATLLVVGLAAAFIAFGKEARGAIDFVVNGIDGLLRKLNDLSGGILGNVAQDLADFAKDVTNIIFGGDTLSGKESKALGKKIVDDIATGMAAGTPIQDTINNILASGVNPAEAAKALRGQITSNATPGNPLFQRGPQADAVNQVLQALTNAPQPKGNSLIDRVKELGKALGTDLQPGIDKLNELEGKLANVWHYFTLGLGGGEIGGKSGTQTTFFQIGSFIRTEIIPAIEEGQTALSKFFADLQKGAFNQGPQMPFGPTAPGAYPPGQAPGVGFDIGAGIRSAIPEIKQLIDDLWNYLKGKFSELADAPWGKALSNIIVGVGAAIQFVQPLIEPLANAIGTILGGAIDVVVHSIKLFVDIIAGDWDSAWKDMLKAAEGLGRIMLAIPKAIIEGVVAITPELLKIGGWIINQIFGTIWRDAKPVVEAGTGAISTLLDAIGTTGDWLLNGGKWIIDQLVMGVGQAAGTIYKTGSDIVEGIWEGIKGAGETFARNLKQWVVDRIPSEIKKLLGIGSPSRVGMQIGKDFVQGISTGLMANAEPMISGFTSKMGTLVSDTASAVGQINDSLANIKTPSMPTIQNGGVQAVSGPNGFAGYSAGGPVTYSNNGNTVSFPGGSVSGISFGSGGYAPKSMFAQVGDAPGGEFILTAQQMIGLMSMIPRAGAPSSSWSQSSMTIENVTLPGVQNAKQFMDELNALQRKESAMRLRLGARGVQI